jgi:transketolase
VLYGQVLRHDPKRPDDESRDRFVLSKGHASLGICSGSASIGKIRLSH